MTSSSRIFIVAGEPSGDLHAAHLMEAIGARRDVRFRGFGGAAMKKAGLDCLEDLPAQAIMGLFPVIKALPRIRGWFDQALRDFDDHRPDALILVDYPGFNLRLAARAHERGIPVYYFISPQVWAWNRRRVKTVAEVVDLMLCILPFEPAAYEDTELDCLYVGHPQVDHLAAHPPDPRLTESIGAEVSPVVGLFPGSRRHVVKSLWPTFRKTIDRLARRAAFDGARFVVAAYGEEAAEIVATRPPAPSVDFKVVVGRPYEVMTATDLALTTSGTTTLELALHETPMVLAYRVSPVLWTIGRMVIRVPHIGLVNLITERGVVPEHIGVRSMHEALADDLADLWENAERRAAMKKDLVEVKQRLQTPGAYDRAADAIVARLAKNDDTADATGSPDSERRSL